jgi:uncharacterized protein
LLIFKLNRKNMPRLDYFAPGVYVEEVDRGSRPVEGIQTNIAGFVGFSEAIRGGAKLGQPKLITSWNEYLKYFGKEGSDGFTDFDAYLPFAVDGWFKNGGARCWVVSVGTQIPQIRQGNVNQNQIEPPPLIIKNAGQKESLKFTLKEEQRELGSVTVKVLPGTALSEPEDLDVSPPEQEFFTVVVERDGQELERYEHLTMNKDVRPDVGNLVENAINEGLFRNSLTEVALQDGVRNSSQYITVEDLTQRGLPLSRRPVDGQYEVSAPIEEPTADNLTGRVQGKRNNRSGIQGLYEIDEITIIACPDLMRLYQEKELLGDDVGEKMSGIMELMISLCENSAPNPPNRMVVLDAPPNLDPQQVSHWLDHEFNRRSMFAALYYPWIKVPNPRKNNKPIAVPPCGHMMGIWSRTDETRGVYKAPANETPRGVIGLAYDCNFREQELLNPKGINCIRSFPNRGIKVWGARTLVEPEKTEWRYINVRRLMSYIEKSIELSTQWVVFEPNDQDLWARVRRTITNFLERLWREGALFGATVEEAFYVKCDETINTPETMLLGRLFVEVGVAPVRPAEFVVFRVSQMTGQDQ